MTELLRIEARLRTLLWQVLSAPALPPMAIDEFPAVHFLAFGEVFPPRAVHTGHFKGGGRKRE